ncbi:MAG: metallopeptidase family protein [candidate division WOR-3 bacterium]
MAKPLPSGLDSIKSTCRAKLQVCIRESKAKALPYIILSLERLDSETFLKLVEDEVNRIPDFFRSKIANLQVMVLPIAPQELAERLGKDPWSILGVYQGVPYNRRGPFYGNVLPDTIIIFQKPIEVRCSTEQEMRELVRRVTIHEIGHYFGFSDEELYRLEKEK